MLPPLVDAQTDPTATGQEQVGGTPEPTQAPPTIQGESLAAPTVPTAAVTTDEQIEALLQQMSPEDRVGQLFVVAFEGNDLSANSDIAALIHDYRIGGVILIPSKENFTNAKSTNTPLEIAQLTNRLQALSYGYVLPPENAILPDGATANNAAAAEPAAAIAAGTVATATVASEGVTLTNALTTTPFLTVPLTTRNPITEQLGLIPLPVTITGPASVDGFRTPGDSTTSAAPEPTATTEVLATASANPESSPNTTAAVTDTVAVTDENASAALVPRMNIPLLIGVEQLGDGYPATAMRRNFTPIPSQLALGSTWNPALVQAVGAIVGSELKTVGVNLLLGPSLDVTNQPRTDPVGALGVHTFGGDPYWVGKMGSAYIAGVHEGGDFQVATIARHFPGQGDIDRLPEQEVATIQQSLPELQRITLPPFWQVTRQSSHVITPTGEIGAVDGLMTSHMRFTAFQGTNSTRIPPISLMPDLGMVLTQEGFTPWHENGGILMTNALGVPAIRRYYEAPLQEFPYRRVALDAFVAGHDLIYLAQLSADGFWDAENEYIKEIIQFFRERYNADPEFQVQVDRAVRRILRLKLGLYRAHNADAAGEDLPPTTPASPESPRSVYDLAPLSEVLVTANDLAIFAEESEHRQQATATIAQVAREALSILYPDLPVFSDLIPAAPQENDQLLIFSDSRLFYECASCTAETTVGPEEIKSIIARLYGSNPGATFQIMPDRVYGRSFVELATLLDSNAQNDATSTPEAVSPPSVITNTATITGVAGQPVPLAASVVPTAPVPLNPNAGSALDATPISGEEGDSVRNEAANETDPNARLQQLINESNWIIFAMLDVDPERNPASVVVKQFLRQQSESLGNKKIIVLALNAPYFLDSTEISKLTAYIGVYSKTQPFLESAVRALFRSYTPVGSPAVSVPGTRFRDLSERLQPDPENKLQLSVTLNGTPVEPSPDNNTAAPIVTVDSIIRIQVDHILDHNGHPVPNGIPVQFHLSYENPEMTIPLEPTLTRNGSASREVILEQVGRLLISASVGEANTTTPFALRVQDPIAEATANAMATSAEVAKGTPIAAGIPLTATVSATGTAVAPTTAPGAGPPTLETPTLTEDWATMDTLIIAMLTILVTLSLLLILQLHILPRNILVHNMLWATICGLGSYILFALGVVPGTTFLLNTLRFWSAAVVVFIGMLLPLLWLRLRAE